MKRSNKVFAKTALATLTAMYVASIGATTSTPQANSPLKVEKVAFNSQVIAARMQAQQAQAEAPSLVQGNGRNVMIKPPQKFIAGPADSRSHTYLIRLRDTPAALHKTMQNDGTAMPLFASNTLGARQQNPLSNPEVASYVQQLKQQQNSFLANAKRQTGIDVVAQHSFQIAINGIASNLTHDDAERLSKLPEVASVRAVQTYDLLTDTSHGRIGTENAWGNTQYGTSSGLKGEGMLVGVIDTGISPSHPMFQATGDDGYTVINPLGSGNYLHDCTLEGFGFCAFDMPLLIARAVIENAPRVINGRVGMGQRIHLANRDRDGPPMMIVVVALQHAPTQDRCIRVAGVEVMRRSCETGRGCRQRHGIHLLQRIWPCVVVRWGKVPAA